MRKLLLFVMSLMMVLSAVGADALNTCTSYSDDQGSCSEDPSCQWLGDDCYLYSAICEDYYNKDDCLNNTPGVSLYDKTKTVKTKETCVWEDNTCFLDCITTYGSDEEACTNDVNDRCEWDADGNICVEKFTGVKHQTASISGQILEVVQMVLGSPSRADAAKMGVDMPETALETLLFVYILPILFLYMILADMFFLMGMFRPNTAKALAAIVALIAARAQVYLKISAMIGSVFNNFFVGSLSLLFGMMIVWWLINHFLLGYRHAKVISTQDSAIDYLDHVGKHLKKLEKE